MYKVLGTWLPFSKGRLLLQLLQLKKKLIYSQKREFICEISTRIKKYCITNTPRNLACPSQPLTSLSQMKSLGCHQHRELFFELCENGTKPYVLFLRLSTICELQHGRTHYVLLCFAHSHCHIIFYNTIHKNAFIISTLWIFRPLSVWGHC